VKKLITGILISCLLGLAVGCVNTTNSPQDQQSVANIEFKDDLGKKVRMEKPAERIISLYSAHTENLFTLGLDKEIIGVSKSDAYPPAVKEKEIFDYRSDPEKVIAVNPDLVLIRPHIQKSAPDFVEALENAHINVVALYPETYKEFAPYINKLALLTGKEAVAEELIKKFEEDLNNIHEVTSEIEPKVQVYFESTENQYRTITNDSTPAHAIELAGGINVASDAEPIREGSSIAAYGAERILEKADKIDVYVAQRGTMNAGGNPHSISIRPGFNAIKALKENRIYNIDEKLISSPTFRFVKGVKEMGRMFYPEIFDDLSVFDNEEEVSREKMAQISVMFKHRVIFTPTSKYYRKAHRGHIYGTFNDVPINHSYFDYIETAVLSGYMEGNENKFYPDKALSRDELAKILFMLAKLQDVEGDILINDINECSNSNIVEIVVKNGLMQLNNSCFNPSGLVKGHEVVDALKKIEEISRVAN